MCIERQLPNRFNSQLLIFPLLAAATTSLTAARVKPLLRGAMEPVRPHCCKTKTTIEDPKFVGLVGLLNFVVQGVDAIDVPD